MVTREYKILQGHQQNSSVLLYSFTGYIEAHHMDGKECHCSHNFAKEHSNYIGCKYMYIIYIVFIYECDIIVRLRPCMTMNPPYMMWLNPFLKIQPI